MNNRSKGIARVREVRKLLEGMGHEVCGPGYGVAFFGGKMSPVHRDYFGLWDLISYRYNTTTYHQVTDLTNKSSKIKAIQKRGFYGWVWCRYSLKSRKVGYRVFFITPDTVTEGEAVFVSPTKTKNTHSIAQDGQEST